MQIASLIIGATISGFIGIGISWFTIYRTNYKKALSEFINSFIDEIIFISDHITEQISAPYNPPKDYTEILLKARCKHRKAIEVFRQYIKPKRYTAICNAYQNYYNPRHQIEELNTIDIISFGLYNMDKEEVKNTIGCDICGLELALENINKIINFKHINLQKKD